MNCFVKFKVRWQVVEENVYNGQEKSSRTNRYVMKLIENMYNKMTINSLKFLAYLRVYNARLVTLTSQYRYNLTVTDPILHCDPHNISTIKPALLEKCDTWTSDTFGVLLLCDAGP